MASKAAGPLLIALAALLWATDAPFRVPTIRSISTVWVVFLEHLIGLSCMLAWVVLGKRSEVLKLKFKDWVLIALIGIGASAFASLFFTASFKYINPSLTILLQKVQPILVVLLAYVFLGERPKDGFYRWAALAIAAAVVLSFPDFEFGFLTQDLDLHSKGVAYALGAAGLWASATVLGKSALRRVAPSSVSFWRYFFGLLTLGVLAAVGGTAFPAGALANPKTVQALLYIGIFPGLVAMIAYYKGLARTSASVTTFVELLYPISAIALNTILLESPLNTVQLMSATVLVLSVGRISLL